MLNTFQYFGLFAIIKIMIICGQISSYTTKLLNVLTTTLRTNIVKFTLIPTI